MNYISFFSAVTIDSDANWITVIIAFLISTIGPFAGTYLYLKNSNKLLGAAAGALNKASKWGQKHANKYAKEKYDNSQFGIHRATSKAFKNQAARERAFSGDTRLSKLGIGGVGAFAGGTMPWNKRGKEKLTNYADSQRDKIYQEEYAASKASIQRDSSAAYGAGNAEAYLKKQIASGASKAQIHAATENLLSQNGGGTTLKNLLSTDSDTLRALAGNEEMWNGAMKGAANDSKFMGKHTDVKNAVINKNPYFRQAALDGWSENFMGENFKAGEYLKDGSGAVVKQKDEAGNLVPVEIADGTEKGWGWVGERSHMILGTHQSNAKALSSQVTYAAAVQAQSAIDNGADGGADPLIKAMIADIVAAGAPAPGGAKNNYVPPTNAAARPDWYKQ